MKINVCFWDYIERNESHIDPRQECFEQTV
jgi:hypothetical protein